MHQDDADFTVVRPRPEIAPAEPAEQAEPEDLEADTLVPPVARREPETLVEPPALVEPPPLVEPPALLEPPALVEPPALLEPPALVEPPALLEPPRGHPFVVERPVSPRAGLPIDPDGLTVLWHRIRINRHEPIPLDIPALIGRQPVCPRIAIGGVPRLVRVPSPRCEVSSTHIELRQHGASVIVTDLRSTNGTIVSIPGSSSQKLRQGESLVVSAGTVVDIGDGNTVEILPIERLV